MSAIMTRRRELARLNGRMVVYGSWRAQGESDVREVDIFNDKVYMVLL